MSCHTVSTWSIFRTRTWEKPRDSKWGAVNPQSLVVPSAERVAQLEADFLPKGQQRDYEGTWGHPVQM